MTTRKPEDLTRDELLDIVRATYDALWVTDGRMDTMKHWSMDTIDEIVVALDRHDLIPASQEGERT